MTTEDSTQIDNKKPPTDLLIDIKEAVQSYGSFTDNWGKVLTKGDKYGFSADQCYALAKPFLKQLNLTKNQLQYIANMDKERQRSKDNREKQKRQLQQQSMYVQPNDDKNDIEQSSTTETIEYVPKPIDQPTKTEQEYIKSIETETVPSPDLPAPQTQEVVMTREEDMTLEQLRERNRQRWLQSQSQVQQHKPATMRAGNIANPVLLMHTEKGDYEIVLTVRYHQDSEIVTVDPVHRRDLKKVSAVPTIVKA